MVSDVREVNAALRDAVKTDLQRRRELAAMTKPELISLVVKLERQRDS